MIEIKGLTKKYGSFYALQGLDLTINEGTVFGFVGANGAGKSTTFSILSTLLQPTAGEAFIDGISVTQNPEEIRKLIGYMPDFFGVYDQLKAEEYLDFFGSSYGIPTEQRAKLIPQLLELVNLSHILPELAEMCDEIGVIEQGKLIAHGSVAEIQAQLMGERFITVKYQAGYDLNLAKQFLEENPFVSSIEITENKLNFRFNGSDEDQMKLLKQIVQHEVPILSFAEDEKDLEDVFMAITEEVEKE